MKKLFLATFAFLLIFSFTACDRIENAIDEDLAETDAEIMEEEASYIGEWSRISATLDGVPQDVTAATITMTADTFESSTSYCAIAGDLVVTEEIMDVFITNNGCPSSGTNNYIYSFILSEDGNTITFTNTQFGGTMVEVYNRIADEDED